MTTKNLAWPLYAVCLFGLLACKANHIQMLTERSEMYNQQIRWQNLAGASTHFEESQRKTLMESLSQELDSIKIVDYGVLDLAVDPSKQKASIIVEYTYYGNDQNLKKSRELQLWEFQKKNWFLTKTQKLLPKNKL